MTHRIPLRLLLAGLILTCTVSVNRTASAQPNPANVLMKVEAWVAQNQWTTALHELRQSKIPDEAKLQWLEQKAEEGSGAAQFELAATLHPRDLETSLKWYARAVLSSALDAASCTQPMRYHVMLDRVEPVRTDGIEQPDLLERAIDDAMARPDAMKPTKWSGWVCSARDRLSGETEAASRLEAMKDMAIETKSFKLFAEAARRGREGSFAVTDTGLTSTGADPFNKGAWLDDSNAIFIGDNVAAATEHNTGESAFTWNMATKSYTNITPPTMNAFGVCSHRGETTIALIKPSGIEKEAQGWELRGTFPDLQLGPRATSWKGWPYSSERPLGCNLPAPPPRADRTQIRWLQPEHGYIEATPGHPWWLATTTLVKRDGTRIALPEVFLTGGSLIRAFAPWKDAYLLQGSWDADKDSFRQRFRKRGEGAVLIWLTADGFTRPVSIPYGYWDQSEPPSYAYFAARTGILGIGRRYERDDRAGFAGLFLFESKTRVTRLLAGVVDIFAISPGGCRIALSHKETASARRARIKIVELCATAS